MAKVARAFAGLAAVVIAVGAAAAWQNRSTIMIGTGYKAKILCSGVFVSKRPERDVRREDLRADGFQPLRLLFARVDRKSETVTASLFGFWRRVAVHRKGLGCTLAVDTSEMRLRSEHIPTAVREDLEVSTSEPWPVGSGVDPTKISSDVDRAKLASALDFVFSEPNPQALQRTRAVVVVHRGNIVAERYADGFSQDTALPGWSMSKTALNALIGIAMTNREVADQLRQPVRLPDTGLLPAWRGGAQSGISLSNLMQMTSGLAFEEDYTDGESDVLRMLFTIGDNAAFAAGKSLVAAPGTTWNYSSGSSNIVSDFLRRRFKHEKDYLAFPKRYLFQPLGMRSAVLEPDASGTFTASSFLYASARDWARLGLLYLRNGNWFGVRILPEGWVAKSLEPVKTAPDRRYGLHLWLKLPGRPGLGEPPVPEDSAYMLGFDGQIVAMIPSRELVVVRLGLARKEASWQPERIIGAIAAAFPQKP